MKSREDFNTEEEYHEYLLEHYSGKFHSSLIDSNPESTTDEFNANPAIYTKFAKWAIRHAKALIDQLRTKKK